MLALPFHHIGYVVDDLEHAVTDAVARFGAGPFFVAEHMEFEECTFKGEPAVFDHSSAFGQWGPVRIEFTVIHHTEPTELGVGRGHPRIEGPAGSGEARHDRHDEHRRRQEDRQGDDHASSHAEWITTTSLSAADDTL